MRTRMVYAVLLGVVGLLGSVNSATPTYENLNSVLWIQTSVEYKANSIQTYHVAKQALRQGLENPHWTAALEQNNRFENLPPAVILDLDETVLDNSSLEASLTDSGQTYSDDVWKKWVAAKRAGLVPGAMDFLQFAHANGVAPLYITNRECDPSNEKDPTVELLRSLQLPLDPVNEHLFCDDGNKGDKTDRRRRCADKFRILLLFGDQLGDFLRIPPDAANLEGRKMLFEAHQNLWGDRWFQLSNPTYGSWEGAVGYSVAEKRTHLRK